MSQLLAVTLPPNVHLWDGCIVRVAAIDPGTGDVVSGVNVSNVSLQVDEITGGGPESLVSGPFLLVPGPGA